MGSNFAKPNPISQDDQDFIKDLATWILEPNIDEEQVRYRQIAVREILECKERKGKYLSLSSLNLTSLPDSIGYLTGLESLNLEHNRLSNLPDSIINLKQLTTLNLYNNRLSNLPDSIGYLEQLESLYLEKNRINTLPNYLFNHDPQSQKPFFINLNNNQISPAESQRINQLAQNKGITISHSIYEAPQLQETTQNIFQKIIDQAPTEEERQYIAAFLQKPDLLQFNHFLDKCQRTEGWQKDNGQEMSSALFGLVEQMSQSESLKTKCVAIAAFAFETFGDRVASSYVYKLLTQNIGQTPIEQMQPEQLFEYAKKETITKFLNEKAEEKVGRIKRGGRALDELDEIETHLAYLQAAPKLGLELPAINMLYRSYLNVSEQDLINAVAEFNQRNADGALVINHIFEDSELRKHPKIKELIASSATKFGTELQKNETRAEYEKRLEEAKTEDKQITLQAINQFFQKSLLAENSTQISAPSPTISSVGAQNIGNSKQSSSDKQGR